MQSVNSTDPADWAEIVQCHMQDMRWGGTPLQRSSLCIQQRPPRHRRLGNRKMVNHGATDSPEHSRLWAQSSSLRLAALPGLEGPVWPAILTIAVEKNK